MAKVTFLTPAQAEYLAQLIEVDEGEHAPETVDADALCDMLWAIANQEA